MRWEEIIGISATILVFIGFTQSKTTHIRIFNSLGCVLFVIYGILIGAFSTWFLNISVLMLNLFKIYKEYKKEKLGENY